MLSSLLNTEIVKSNKLKQVVIVIKQPLERIPPIINLIDALISDKRKVKLLCTSISSPLLSKYKDNVEIFVIDVKLKRTRNKIRKVISWLWFRSRVLRILEKEFETENSILWIGTADAGLALGKKLFTRPYIFQCHELYDAIPFYRKRIGVIMQKSIINVTPERNRAAIFRTWYSLNETPITLPNKPYYHPKNRNLNLDNLNVSKLFDRVKGKKVVIYQGGILAKRDVGPIAKAIEKMGDDWILLLMGHTDNSGYLQSLLSSYPKLVYIPPIPAPDHLRITSWAHIGLLTYSFHDLNHVFCAPNKIWEYAGFGIPMLGNDIPGIAWELDKFSAGLYVNLETADDNMIENALYEIDNNYSFFRNGALSLFQSIEIKKITDRILALYEDRLSLPEP